jgi:hypothetical protein
MRLTRWVKNKLDAFVSKVPEPEPPEEEAPTHTCRFKVTTKDEPPKTLYVYGRDELDVRRRLLGSMPIAGVEPAGHVISGVVHFPPEELREVMASMQDGRRAPGA